MVVLDLTTRRIEGYVDDICLSVGGHDVTADFIVLNTGYNKADPIILDRHFLHTVRASIYLSTANMHFNINGTRGGSPLAFHTSGSNSIVAPGVTAVTSIPLRFEGRIQMKCRKSRAGRTPHGR